MPYGCDVGLGLKTSKISDSQITSSLLASNPQHGRLDHPTSAWCFEWAKVQDTGEDIYLEIDLGDTRLVSGFQSQGPPGALHSLEYISYISLSMEVSMEREAWSDCCSESDATTYFYVDDKEDEINKVKTHLFHKLVSARYIRIKVSTSLRWIGHDEKCFRFEILGCAGDSVAVSNLSATAKSPGYIAVEWQSPVVKIPPAQDFGLEGRFYLVNITHYEQTGTVVNIHNTSDLSFIYPSPLYNSVYSVSLTCWHDCVPMPCGQVELRARPEVSLSCKAHTSFCGEDERVVFVKPDIVRATYLANGSMLVEWNNTRGGWRTESVVVRVMDGHWAGRRLLEKQIFSQDSRVMVDNLVEGAAYEVTFNPSGSEVPTDVGKVSASLAILSNNGSKVGFISLVRLQAHVVWSGKIIVSWEQAMARGINSENNLVLLMADEYKVTLTNGQGTSSK